MPLSGRFGPLLLALTAGRITTITTVTTNITAATNNLQCHCQRYTSIPFVCMRGLRAVSTMAEEWLQVTANYLSALSVTYV